MTKVVDFKTRFFKEILPELKKTLNLKNDMAVPRVKKVTINIGIGTWVKTHGKDVSSVVDSLTLLSGQKPVVTKARLAISNFKLKQGDPVGITVTLRGKRMYDFLNKLVNIVFPRVRDFRGISPKGFDNRGNYSVGMPEHIVFPEVNPEDIGKIYGLQMCITTSAKNPEEGLALLKALGFPFKK